MYSYTYRKQVAVATAQILFQRFWFVTSMKQFGIGVSRGTSRTQCRFNPAMKGCRNGRTLPCFETRRMPLAHARPHQCLRPSATTHRPYFIRSVGLYLVTARPRIQICADVLLWQHLLRSQGRFGCRRDANIEATRISSQRGSPIRHVGELLTRTGSSRPRRGVHPSMGVFERRVSTLLTLYHWKLPAGCARLDRTAGYSHLCTHCTKFRRSSVLPFYWRRGTWVLLSPRSHRTAGGSYSMPNGKISGAFVAT